MSIDGHGRLRPYVTHHAMQRIREVYGERCGFRFVGDLLQKSDEVDADAISPFLLRRLAWRGTQVYLLSPDREGVFVIQRREDGGGDNWLMPTFLRIHPSVRDAVEVAWPVRP